MQRRIAVRQVMQIIAETKDLVSQLTVSTKQMAEADDISGDELAKLTENCRSLRVQITKNLQEFESTVFSYMEKGEVPNEAMEAYEELRNQLRLLQETTDSVIATLRDKMKSADEEIQRVRMTQKALGLYKYHQL